jgi:predicted nucleotidyltransferase
MAEVVTLDERKRARVAEIRDAVARLRQELADYGKTHGGRFWLYGSAVTGQIRYDSDIDVLVDFDSSRQADAFDFLEAACARLRLKLDARPKARCTRAFIDRIAPKAVVLP